MQIVSNGDNLHEMPNPIFLGKIIKNISICRPLHSFVCVKVLRSSQLNGVISSAVSLPNHMFTGQA